MKNDALNRFKEEMNRRGLIRKIQVCANLIPPPRLMRTGDSSILICFISVAPQYSSKCISIYLVLLSNSNISAALFAKLLIS